MSSPTTYEFKMSSLYISLDDFPARAYDVISMTDSVFQFYPEARVVVNDEGGMIADKYYYIEGEEFSLELGEPDIGYLSNSYVWSSNSVGSMNMEDFISGKANFTLRHSKYALDKERGRAFNLPIAEVVKMIAQKDFKLTLPELTNVGITMGVVPQYQMGRTNSQFIISMANCAYDQSYKTSPFLTFFNSAGELYFMPIAKMFAQPSIGTYKFSPTAVKEPDSIKSASLHCLGMDVTKNLYQQKVWKIVNTGEAIEEIFALKDYYNNIDLQHKLLIPFDKMPFFTEVNQQTNVGYIDTITELFFYNGLVNNQYTLANLAYQMKIMIDFNPQAISGKIITIEVGSNALGKVAGTEHSGKWLIIQSEHTLDKNGIAYSSLLLAKSGIPVDLTHPLYSSFVGAGLL